jgi:hypothetical protein
MLVLSERRLRSMTTTTIQCTCGSVAMDLTGQPILQYYCHCDDCQAVHGKAYAVALFPATAVSVAHGDTEVFTLRATPRTKCKRCGMYLFAEVSGFSGVNGELLPQGMFVPEFHIQCRYAPVPIQDDLPHYRGTPARFRGSDELMEW